MTSPLGNLVERERAMTKLVNNGPEEHLDLVEKMQKGLKVRRWAFMILVVVFARRTTPKMLIKRWL